MAGKQCKAATYIPLSPSTVIPTWRKTSAASTFQSYLIWVNEKGNKDSRPGKVKAGKSCYRGLASGEGVEIKRTQI